MASTICCMPSFRELNSGRGGCLSPTAPSCCAPPAWPGSGCRTSLPSRRSAASTARALSLFASPPYTPDSNGSASRSTTSAPKWRSTSSPTVSSSCIGRGGCISSCAMRTLVLHENSGDKCGGHQLGRHHEHQPVGHDDQLAVYHNVGLSLRVVGADKLVVEAELFAERRGPGFFGEERVGTGLDQAAFYAIGARSSRPAAGRSQRSCTQCRRRRPALFPDRYAALRPEMPPPIIAIRFMGQPMILAARFWGPVLARWLAAQAGSGQIGDGLHERRRIVQRLSAIELHATCSPRNRGTGYRCRTESPHGRRRSRWAARKHRCAPAFRKSSNRVLHCGT